MLISMASRWMKFTKAQLKEQGDKKTPPFQAAFNYQLSLPITA
jgi:hypothetical protein